MTFCLGIKVKDGLVGIADTRVTSGTERITARKVTTHQHGNHSLFLMTSGLRSVRDKALTYFEDVLEGSDVYTRLYQVVNAFADQVRRVAFEDQPSLSSAGLSFNLYALVGGQLEDDKEHRLYMIYPQGNWVEVGQATPFYIIGESGYGKPILERTISFESDLPFAIKAGFLAFNATITCATDVDYPIDIVVYRQDRYEVFEQRFTRDDTVDTARFWHQNLQALARQLPAPWVERLLTEYQEKT